MMHLPFYMTLIGAWSAALACAAVDGVRSYAVEHDGPDRFPHNRGGAPAPWFVSGDDFPGVLQVARHLQNDVELVAGIEPQLGTDGRPSGTDVVIVGTLGRSPLIDDLVVSGNIDAAELAGRWEKFVIQTVDDPLPGVARALIIAGDVPVTTYVSPTIDFTAGDGLKYAVSFDDEQPLVVNIDADSSREPWGMLVANNINGSQSTHAMSEAGQHVLKFWMVDPGVVLQRIVVETSEAPASYLGPPKSKLVMEVVR